MKISVFASATVLIAQAFIGCTTSWAGDDFGAIKINTPGGTNPVPMAVANAKGFDKEEGFTASFMTINGQIAVKSMIAGDFPFTLSAGSALAAALTGAPIKIISVHVDRPVYYLFAREAIQNMKDLQGKRIGVDSVGGTSDIVIRRAMRDAGVDPATATFLVMQTTNVPLALIGGAIDAAVINPPNDLALKGAKVKFSNLGLLGETMPGLMGGIATTDRVIREQPNLVRALLRAQAKGLRFVFDHPDETISIMKSSFNLSSIEDATDTYEKAIRPIFLKSAVISSERQQAIIEELARGNNNAKVTEASRLFDFSLSPK